MTAFEVRPVVADQWEIVGWLWQLFRHDLALVVNGLPYADGRYQHAWLDEHPRPDGWGYLAWAPHPDTGEAAPIGFATVLQRDGVFAMQSFFVVPVARRSGVGLALAEDVIERHDGPWEVAFQRDNVAAGIFWRRVAAERWGTGWAETAEPVPGRPELPPDHWIRTR